jgi:hypothetical protein
MLGMVLVLILLDYNYLMGPVEVTPLWCLDAI